jgi:acetoacetyl-CoA synthetase
MLSDSHGSATETQWTPSPVDIEAARVTDFTRFVRTRGGDVEVGDYHSLWRWSVRRPEDFWQLLWDYFDVAGTRGARELADAGMPGATWFPGSQLNYVEQVIRNSRPDRPAIVSVFENDAVDQEVSWSELLRQVGTFAEYLRGLGVGPGDRVVGYLPNIPEAVVAFLATASLGAIWAACGQDYTAHAAASRLGQLNPTVLVAADGYTFAGKIHDKRGEVADLAAAMTSVTATVVVTRLFTPAADPAFRDWDAALRGDYDLRPVPVPFDHPLWVVFSSGTTGKPKGIVHGHGGVLLEHLKAVGLQLDLGADDTLFWYTSPSWMMWNFQVAALLVGATVVCYPGSPTHPSPDALWQLASRVHTTVFGTSPGYVLACAKAGVTPAIDHDLQALRTVGVTGAALSADSSMWLHHNIGGHVRVSSMSGGTDVVSAFVGGVRIVPVYPGELSAPYLGVALDAFDPAGNSVRGAVGELVITQPMPSMPLSFWNDADGSRYRGAYFDVYPGVWRHGDWITITDRGTVVVHGRSDSTLNRNGIRMGSAEIYEAVEALPEVAEALVIGAEQADGGYWMPLFVVLADDAVLDEQLKERIATAIRRQASPRHVPDEVIVAPGIPHTKTGKKLEVPIKKIIQGSAPLDAVDAATVDAPNLLDWYAHQRPSRH